MGSDEVSTITSGAGADGIVSNTGSLTVGGVESIAKELSGAGSITGSDITSGEAAGVSSMTMGLAGIGSVSGETESSTTTGCGPGGSGPAGG